ncbi:MAG: sensor histidine kinase [Nitrospiria bacterium]
MDAALLSAYRAYLQKINIFRIRLACVLGCGLVPLFSILDYFIFPDQFIKFLMFRTGCALTLALLFGVTFTSTGKRNINIIGVCVPLLVGGTVSIMIRYLGGYESTYYAGLNLIILALTLLYVWDLRMSIGVCLILYGFYMVPIVLYDEITHPEILINNTAFLLTTAIIGLTSAYFVSKLRYQEFESVYRLDESQKALQKSNEKLRELGALKNQFFADISHELRTPLSIIRGEAEVSMRGKDKPVREYKGVLQYIIQMTEQVNKLVSDLLFLARSESGSVQIEKKAVSLHRILKRACREGDVLAVQKGVTLLLRDDRDGKMIVQGDHQRLVQLFLIIIDNAIKYSHPGGKIGVSIRGDEERGEVVISDNGIGIPEDALPHIFDRFYRVPKTKTMSRTGTGLGLSIAKWIVEAHNGQISVKSVVENGTTVSIHLPLS